MLKYSDFIQHVQNIHKMLNSEMTAGKCDETASQSHVNKRTIKRYCWQIHIDEW